MSFWWSIRHSFLSFSFAQYFCASARHAREPPCSSADATSGSKAASAQTISRWPPMVFSLFAGYVGTVDGVRRIRITVGTIVLGNLVLVSLMPLVAQLALVAMQPMLVMAQ